MLDSGGKLWGIPHSKKALGLEPALFLSILGSLDSPDPEHKPRSRIAGVWETSAVLLPAIYPVFYRGYLKRRLTQRWLTQMPYSLPVTLSVKLPTIFENSERFSAVSR